MMWLIVILLVGLGFEIVAVQRAVDDACYHMRQDLREATEQLRSIYYLLNDRIPDRERSHFVNDTPSPEDFRRFGS